MKDLESHQRNTLAMLEPMELTNMLEIVAVNLSGNEVPLLNNSANLLPDHISEDAGQTWGNFSAEGKLVTKLHSSNPDIRTDDVIHIHFEPPDCWTEQSDGTEENRNHVRGHKGHEAGKNVSSNILSFFRSSVPGSYSDCSKRLGFKEIHLPRKFSMDSQLRFKQQRLIYRAGDSKPSKRSIKLSHPGHSSVMYLSGADTLGGLPDDDSQHHHLNLTAQYSATLFPRPVIYRRSSCPVIFEGEESDYFSSPRKLSLDCSSSDPETHLPSRTKSAHKLSDHTSSSSDDSTNETDKQRHFARSRHFFVGSDPLEGSDEVNPCGTPALHDRVPDKHDQDPGYRKHRKSLVNAADTRSSSVAVARGTSLNTNSREKTGQSEPSKHSSEKSRRHNAKKQQEKNQNALGSNTTSPRRSTAENSKKNTKTKAIDAKNLARSMSSTDSSGSVEEADSSHYLSDVSSDE